MNASSSYKCALISRDQRVQERGQPMSPNYILHIWPQLLKYTCIPVFPDLPSHQDYQGFETLPQVFWYNRAFDFFFHPEKRDSAPPGAKLNRPRC